MQKKYIFFNFRIDISKAVLYNDVRNHFGGDFMKCNTNYISLKKDAEDLIENRLQEATVQQKEDIVKALVAFIAGAESTINVNKSA